MRRILKLVGLFVAALVVLVVGFLVYVQVDGIPRYPVEKVTFRADPTPERLERGKRLVNTLCASCHMDPTTRQLTGKHMLDAPAEFGDIYSVNITRHPTKGIGSWTDGAEIAYLLRTGVKRDGQYTPPWMVNCPTSPTRTSHQSSPSSARMTRWSRRPIGTRPASPRPPS